MFSATEQAMSSPGNDLTINGCHLNEEGYSLFADTLFKGTFDKLPTLTTDILRNAILDRNRQYFRRYRPLNTFYYTRRPKQDVRLPRLSAGDEEL